MKISVVMSVYNGAETLRTTLSTVLAQTEGDFELIVVDDGSSDETAAILREHAAVDPRLRIITQSNRGLTEALIRGCDAAEAPVIARHDCGDRSRPDRLARQLGLIRRGAVLVSCSVRYVTPAGEHLFTAGGDGAEIRRSLREDMPPQLHGIPHHGSAMFTREAYRAAGGYRAAFRYAQDLDLWIRMAPLGEIAVDPEELYEATIAPGAISSRSRDAQVRLSAIAAAVRDGGDEETLLTEAAAVRASKRSQRVVDAAALYFMAKCLRKQRNPVWRRYLWRSIERNPLSVRAWLSLLQR